MFETRGFYDLCLQESLFTQEDSEDVIKRLYDYGYKTIAVNQLIEDKIIEPKKKKKKGEPRETQDIVPQPYNVAKLQELASNFGYYDFKVLNRLTVSFASQDVFHKITKSPNYKKYDLVACAPTTNQALMFTCNTFEADIFTFNPENKFNLRLSRKTYNQLIERGYHFELLYSPAVEDSSKRKNLIHASHLYHSLGKSRNIFFSSGATTFIYIRGPYDIINLGFIFGLGELQSRCAVNEFPQKIVVNSIGRRHGKAVMFVDNLDKEKEEEEDMDQPKVKKTKR